MKKIESNSLVFHKSYGQCTVRFVDGETAIIRTPEGELAECSICELAPIKTIWEDDDFSSIKALLRIQSSVISSINNTWGIFSRTVIKLLPHQLWVCNRVMRRWPARMLIADDVGLGKTIEAGLILLSAINSGRAERILIITPASLTWQWQERMKTYFGLNFDVYQTSGNDNQFIKKQLIASIASLRIDRNNRHAKLLDADKWDLVIIDEAHHAGVSSEGPTLGYELIKKMEGAGKIDSLLFFTATPHQGKDDSFWKLMELLDEGAFSQDVSDEDKYRNLPDFMIRNNKATVTDMEGKKLFKGIIQHPDTYVYTVAEAEFYNKMTEYIEKGYAYASTLDEKTGSQVTLVLIALQKIASSSIAAIRKALENRLSTLEKNERKCADILSHSQHDFTSEDTDSEPIAEASLSLMVNEIFYIKELIALASRIKEESRIKRILEIVQRDYPDEPILFFTEYKATQALIISALRHEYGDEQVSFINGDEALTIDGRPESIKRECVMEKFNNGKLKYLVSTEASGEGVDLQKRCHVLIHVDLPWNPMRLHQRVGRIYRLGQTKDVDVVTLRNPLTIEGMIWDKLDTKLDTINHALGFVMDNPEDMKMLVLGVHSASMYEKLFADGLRQKKESLSEWFNSKTKSFGGKSAIETIRTIEGNASRFDLSSLDEVPKFPLERLKSFFINAIRINDKTPRYNDEGHIVFSIPEEWYQTKGSSINLAKFSKADYTFSRDDSNVKQLCAVGDRFFNAALKQAREFDDNFALISGNYAYIIFRVYERITTQRRLSSYTFVGYKLCDNYEELIDEASLFELLDNLLKEPYPKMEHCDNRVGIISTEKAEQLRNKAILDYKRLGVDYEYPESEIYALLAPRSIIEVSV